MAVVVVETFGTGLYGHSLNHRSLCTATFSDASAIVSGIHFQLVRPIDLC